MDLRGSSTVHIVDDDADFRASLELMLRSISAADRIEYYESAEEFLDTLKDVPDSTRCLLLDIGLPRMNGIALQEELKRRGFEIPIVVLTGLSDVPLAVQAVKSGALDVIEKPPSRERLAAALAGALAADSENRARRTELLDIVSRLESLSQREREVMVGILEGHFTKDLAAALGIGTQTVLKHRSNMLKKMNVRNEVSLSTLLASVGLLPADAFRAKQPADGRSR